MTTERKADLITLVVCSLAMVCGAAAACLFLAGVIVFLKHVVMAGG